MELNLLFWLSFIKPKSTGLGDCINSDENTSMVLEIKFIVTHSVSIAATIAIVVYIIQGVDVVVVVVVVFAIVVIIVVNWMLFIDFRPIPNYLCTLVISKE